MSEPLIQPIEWETIEGAIFTWFQDSTGANVMWANQDAPQLPYPLGTLKIIAGPTMVGGDDDSRQDAISPAPDAPLPPLQITTAGQREITVSCQITVGPPENQNPLSHARAMMSAAQSALGMDSVRSLLRRAEVSVIEVLPVQAFDIQIADGWAARSVLDVRFGIVSNVVEKIQIIETVHIEADAPLSIDDDFGVGE